MLENFYCCKLLATCMETFVKVSRQLYSGAACSLMFLNTPGSFPAFRKTLEHSTASRALRFFCVLETNLSYSKTVLSTLNPCLLPYIFLAQFCMGYLMVVFILQLIRCDQTKQKYLSLRTRRSNKIRRNIFHGRCSLYLSLQCEGCGLYLDWKRIDQKGAEGLAGTTRVPLALQVSRCWIALGIR